MSDAPQNGTKARNGLTAVAPEAVRDQMERIVADPLFRYSHRSINLLRYIVERTLQSHTEDLKERIIGIEVFGRTPDYDTSNDSTVRVVANEVRKRLLEYYAKSEHASEIRIEIPVRTYIAEFRALETAAPAPLAVEPAALPTPVQRFKRGWLLWGVASVLVVVFLFFGGIRWLKPVPVNERFWSPLTKSSEPVLICIGSPYELKANDATTESAPMSASPGTPFYDYEQRVYVRMMDAAAADHLARYLKQYGKDSVVRPTQGMQLTDLQADPLILYGMALNEWAEKLGSDLRYVLRKDTDSGHGVRWIEDTQQRESRKWSVNLAAPYQQVSTDYALISRVQDRTTGRWWVGIAGLTGVGALAASQVLMDANAMANVGAALPRGWENKNLQIVLETKVVQGRPGTTQVVTAYSW